jgi:hypothetical protein
MGTDNGYTPKIGIVITKKPKLICEMKKKINEVDELSENKGRV